MSEKERGKKDWAKYYDDKDILSEITYDPVDLSLDDHLRQDILSGKRRRKLKNITIKIQDRSAANHSYKKAGHYEIYALPNPDKTLACRGD